MKPTLLIMAAGLGSRFGSGIKQLQPVGPNDELIMDYSIHDAIEAGFGKIIFVIRREMEAEFRAVIGSRIEAICGDKGVFVSYVYQELTAIPGQLPAGRVKPWGTGQAVLAAKDLIQEPFVVINADDYYGKQTFRTMYAFLTEPQPADTHALAGFLLRNTLSDHGAVTRGICQVGEHGMLLDVQETRGIRKNGTHIVADGTPLEGGLRVSMNLWGLFPSMLKKLDKGFQAFFREAVPQDPLEAEFLLPVFIGRLLRNRQTAVQMLPVEEQWYGVTYQEDVPAVRRHFAALHDKGLYQQQLYSDLKDVLGPNKTLFRARLRQIRKKKRIVAWKMSKTIGQNMGYINNIESGKSMPSMIGFFRICEYLEVTPQEFFNISEKDVVHILQALELDTKEVPS